MKKLLAIAALALVAGTANATLVSFTGGATSMNFWFTQGVNGSSSQNLYQSSTGPGYACYGLTTVTPTCAGLGTPSAYTAAAAAAYSGSLNDDLSFLNLSWTGVIGNSATVGTSELFNNTVTSGTYDASGNATGAFGCWNKPSAGGFATVNFCGNPSGNKPFTTAAAQTIATRQLTDGFVLFTDNTDGTITIDLSDSTYGTCVADANCSPGSSSSNIFAQWTLNVGSAVPVPAAVWLFGSALGLLGWIRRRATV